MPRPKRWRDCAWPCARTSTPSCPSWPAISCACAHSPNDGVAPEGVSETAPPPRPLEPLWAVPSPRLLGVCGLGYDLGVKGLMLAGRQTLPGLGVEGELEAAFRAAKLIAGTSKKRDAAGIG